MNHVRSLLSASALAAAALLPSSAQAAGTTYTFATNVALSPDHGTFLTDGYAPFDAQETGGLQIAWTDNGNGTYSLATGPGATFLGFSQSASGACTAQISGPSCMVFDVDATRPTSVTFDGNAWHVGFSMVHGSWEYAVSLTIGRASYLGGNGNGAVLAGMFHSYSGNNQWIAASGALSAQ